MTTTQTQPKEIGVLFNGPMVRAILEGRKTQTRRPVERVVGVGKVTEFGPSDTPGYDWHYRDKRMRWHDRTNEDLLDDSPLGKPGDVLWGRETCRAHEWSDEEAEQRFAEAGGQPAGLVSPQYGLDVVVYEADGEHRRIDPTLEASERWMDLYHYRGKRGATVPSIHMPRWASRLTLEVVSVKVEQIQSISEEDAVKEGVYPAPWYGEHSGFYTTNGANEFRGVKDAFRHLWSSTYPGSWGSNDWCWATTFKLLTPTTKATSDHA